MAEARRYSKGSRCLASAGKREVASLRRAQGPSFVAVEAARCWVRQDSSVDKVHEGVVGVDADADAADAVGDVVVAEVEVEVEVAAVVAVVVGVDAGSGGGCESRDALDCFGSSTCKGDSTWGCCSCSRC